MDFENQFGNFWVVLTKLIWARAVVWIIKTLKYSFLLKFEKKCKDAVVKTDCMSSEIILLYNLYNFPFAGKSLHIMSIVIVKLSFPMTSLLTSKSFQINNRHMKLHGRPPFTAAGVKVQRMTAERWPTPSVEPMVQWGLCCVLLCTGTRFALTRPALTCSSPAAGSAGPEKPSTCTFAASPQGASQPSSWYDAALNIDVVLKLNSRVELSLRCTTPAEDPMGNGSTAVCNGGGDHFYFLVGLCGVLMSG